MYRKFKSITTDQDAYAIDTGASYTSSYKIHPHWRMFQVLGDGLCQHSHDWAVTNESLGDFFFSLTSYLLEHSDDEEMIRDVFYAVINHEPHLQSIEFAASVKRKPSDDNYEKRRYFSMKEQKIAGKAKEYDKRYEEIRDWCDGSLKAMQRILMSGNEYPTGLEALLTANAIYNWQKDRDGIWMETPAIFLEWFKKWESDGADEKAKNIRLGLEALRGFLKAWEGRKGAEIDVNNYTGRQERNKKTEETSAA